MKKLMFSVMTAIMIMAVAVAAKLVVEPPVGVAESFKTTYKKVSAVTWKKNASGYVANFKANGLKKTVAYTRAGKFLSSREEVKTAALPAVLMKAFAATNSGKSIKEAELVTKVDGSKNYVLEIKGAKLVYEEGGKFLKKEVKEDKDDEGEEEDDD